MMLCLAALILWTALAPPAGVLKDFAVVQRTGVTESMDLVVALSGDRPIRSWDAEHKLGLFLQDKAHPDRVSVLVADVRVDECWVRIERITAQETILACEVEKGLRFENRKYTYDVRTQKLTGQITYHPFAMYDAFKTPTGVVAVGNDGEHSEAVEFNPERTPTLRVLNETEAGPITAHPPAVMASRAFQINFNST